MCRKNYHSDFNGRTAWKMGETKDELCQAIDGKISDVHESGFRAIAAPQGGKTTTHHVFALSAHAPQQTVQRFLLHGSIHLAAPSHSDYDSSPERALLAHA